MKEYSALHRGVSVEQAAIIDLSRTDAVRGLNYRMALQANILLPL